MKRNLLIALIFILPIAAFSQEYSFELAQGTYTDLVDPISITNGLTWDDPEFAIPIGFDFQILETTMDSLFIEGTVTQLFSSLSFEESKGLLSNYGLD